MNLFLRTFVLGLVGSLAILSAQNEPTSAAPGGDKPAPTAMTAADPAIPVDQLQWLLEPLTKSELEVEAAAWRDLVRASVEKIANASIAMLQADADSEAGDPADAQPQSAKRQAVDELTELQDQKTKLLRRLDLVVSELENKGGEAAELRSYATAVSGVRLDVKDAHASVSAIRGWLKSEEGGIKWASAIAKVAVIMIAFWILAGIVGSLIRRVVDRQRGLSDLLKRFINKLVKRVILLIGVIVALGTVGVNVGALLALIGGGAFIIGFALQDTLGNFAAGLMLLVYRPFDVGDSVEMGGVTGKVDNVSLVSTTIKTFDNKVVLVPNKSVWGQTITNATASPTRRVDLVFGIGYDDDAAKAKALLEKIVTEHELVLDDPEAVIKMHELGNSAVNLICRPWCKTADYWTVYWDVTNRVKQEFDENGLNFPYPQQDVHLHKAG